MTVRNSTQQIVQDGGFQPPSLTFQEYMMDLFDNRSFKSHSGLTLPFKIECDALTSADLETLAAEVARMLKFRIVIPVPSGGFRFGAALQKYADVGSGHPALIVDDVLTTGRSITECKMQENDIGVVIFARGSWPEWVTPLFASPEAVREKFKDEAQWWHTRVAMAAQGMGEEVKMECRERMATHWRKEPS